jgi:hypothetical protein
VAPSLQGLGEIARALAPLLGGSTSRVLLALGMLRTAKALKPWGADAEALGEPTPMPL